MAWDVRQTYYYLVCFATLLMVIIGTAQAVRNTLDLVLPTDPYTPSALDLRERYGPRPGVAAEDPAYTREELEEMAREEAERQRRQQHRNDLRNLLGNLALVLIAAPVYVYHWRHVRRL